MTVQPGFRPRLLNTRLVTAPATDPVTLDEAKDWLRVDGTDQDALITALITAVTQWAEGFTHRAFVKRDSQNQFDVFPRSGQDLYLPGPPIIDLTSLPYRTTADEATTYDVANVAVAKSTGLVRVLPGMEDWPQDAHTFDAIYSHGIDTAVDDIPEVIKTAILVGVAQLFEYRVDQTAGSQLSKLQAKASETLLRPFVVALQ